MKVNILGLAVLSFLLAGCSPLPRGAKGVYNIGLCSPHDYLGVEFSVDKDKISTLAIATGPKRVVDDPPVSPFLFVKREGSVFIYQREINGQVAQLKVTFNGNEIKGVFLVDGVVAGRFTGHRGSKADLLKEANIQYEACVVSQSAGE